MNFNDEDEYSVEIFHRVSFWDGMGSDVTRFRAFEGFLLVFVFKLLSGNE
jgi:hypothetical protein